MRLITGRGEDATSIACYSSQVAEGAAIEGNCLLKHRTMVGGKTQLRDSPILLDSDVLIQGRTAITDDVIVEHQASINDEVQITAQEGEAIHLRGLKTFDGQQHVTRTSLLGALQRPVVINNVHINILIVIATVWILSPPEATFKNEPIAQRRPTTAGIGHLALDHKPVYQPVAGMMVDRGLQGAGKQPPPLVISIDSVADIGHFAPRSDLVERQDVHKLMVKKRQKHSGVTPLMQNHVTLHMATGLLFAVHFGGPVE